MGRIANIGNRSNRTSDRGKSLLDTAPLHFTDTFCGKFVIKCIDKYTKTP